MWGFFQSNTPESGYPMTKDIDTTMTVLGAFIFACSLFAGGLKGEPFLLFAAVPAVLLVFYSLARNREEKSPSSEGKVQEMEADGKEEGIRRIKERYALTDREEEMMILISRGFSRNAISEKLYLSRNTVDTHIRSLYAKLDCHKKDEIIRLVEENAGASSNNI